MAWAYGQRRRAAALVVAALVFSPAAARAQGDTAGVRVAQSLFEEGRALLDAGRYAEACPKLAESQRLDPGGGTLLNLALCYEKLGRTATAWAKYNEALSLAISDRRSEREAFARGRITALAPRLPRVRVQVDGAPDVAIGIDGEAVPRAALDTAMPVDPGTHTVRASAPGRAPWSGVATAREGETETVHVPALAPAPPGSEPVTAALPSPPAGEASAPREMHRSTAFWVAGGVAAAAVVTTAVTGVMALSAHASADDKCDAARAFCPDPTGVDDASRARTLAWVSTGALGVAAVATVVAFVLPREAEAGTGAARAPVVRVGLVPIAAGASFSVGGTFR